MKLVEIFEHLLSSELAHIHLQDDTRQKILPEDYPRVIPALNYALLSVSKKFPLITREVYINLHEQITNYRLSTEYLVSNPDPKPAIKYLIDDLDDPFTDDVLRISSVHNEIGEELPLNVDNARYSVFTPEFNVIRHPYPINGNSISAVYQARIPRIERDGLDPDTLDIRLPPVLLEAVLALVGNRLLAGLRTAEAMQEADRLRALYELSCRQVDASQLINRDNYIDTSYVNTGWR